MAVEQKGLADRLQQALGQQHRVLRPRHPALHDREFVGVEARQRVLLAQRRAQPLGHRAQQLVARAVAERVVDGLEIVEAEHQHRDLLGAAAAMHQHVVHLLAQQIAVGQPGQAVMLRHEGEPRFGALALGHVHQRQKYRRLVAMDQLARIDRQIDQRAVGPHMLPGSRRLLVAGSIADPWQFGVERLQTADGQPLEFGAAIAIMLDRGVVDAEDSLAVQRADDHRHRIAVEQQAERGLALLQFGDVDAQADDAAVRGQPLLDQDDAAVGQHLLMPCTGLIQFGEPLRDPFFLAPDRFRIVAARNPDADRVLQPRAGFEQIRAAAVDFRILLVPEDVAAFGVEKHDALRQYVDRLAQPLMGSAGIGDCRIGLGALAHDLADLARHAPCATRQFRARLHRSARHAGDRAPLQLLVSLRPLGRHQLRPARIHRRDLLR